MFAQNVKVTCIPWNKLKTKNCPKWAFFVYPYFEGWSYFLAGYPVCMASQTTHLDTYLPYHFYINIFKISDERSSKKSLISKSQDNLKTNREDFFKSIFKALFRGLHQNLELSIFFRVFYDLSFDHHMPSLNWQFLPS